MNTPDQYIEESLSACLSVVDSLMSRRKTIVSLCGVVIESLEKGGKVLTAGHGGSAADALHMAEELVGRFEKDRRPLPAIALVADTTLLTCIGNDYGFEQIFPRQIEAHGQPGDVLVIFSSSGNGEGLRRAVELATEKEMSTIALLGKAGGIIKGMATHELIVESNSTARIQEAHTLIMHIILESVDRRFTETEQS